MLLNCLDLDTQLRKYNSLHGIAYHFSSKKKPLHKDVLDCTWTISPGANWANIFHPVPYKQQGYSTYTHTSTQTGSHMKY